jgi:hypothetical protein
MRAKKELLRATCFLVLVTSACMSTADINTTNQERAGPIIQAISSYEQDHRQLPEQLSVLVPTYLPELPLTTAEQDFTYILHHLDGYYLCFSFRHSNAGCCYYHRLELWDCTRGCE